MLVTLALDNIGDASLALGDIGRAREAYAEALARQLADGDPRGASLSQQGLGRVALAEGQLAEAARQLLAGLRGAWRSANRRELTTYVDHTAALLAAQGRHELAARLCAATQAFRQKIGAALTVFEAATHEATRAAASEALGPPAFAAAWAAGTATPLDQLIAEVLGGEA